MMKMIIQLEHNKTTYKTDLSQPLDISIPIKNGNNNPSCYWAEDVKFSTIYAGDFVGSVKEGGTVNYQTLTITPHGNGTHTETFGHITADESATISNLFKDYHSIAELVTVELEQKSNGDMVIDYEEFSSKRKHNTESVIIRTLPNNATKLTRQYSGTNPPYLDYKIAQKLNEQGVKNLLIDLPSVDKEVDAGKLTAHRAFWGLPNNIRRHCSITELIFIPDFIEDGLYLLNLQTLNLDMDASPSRPIIFKLDLF